MDSLNPAARPASLVHLVENAHLHGQSHGRFGLRHIVPGNLQSSEDHPTTGPRHVGKEAVLDRIVLGAVGRVVRDSDLDAKPVRQLLEFLLKHVSRRAVAPASVAQNQQFLGPRVVRSPVFFPPRRDAVAGQFTRVVAGVQVEKTLVPPHVVHPMRDHHARSRAAEIVIVDRDRPLCVDATLTVEIAEQLLLFRVDADDGQPGVQILLLETGYLPRTGRSRSLDDGPSSSSSTPFACDTRASEATAKPRHD